MKKEKENKIQIPGALISFIVLVFLMMMIFGFSAQNADESGSLSTKICEIISGIFSLAGVKISPDLLSVPVRKTAHMTEYACVFADSLYMFRALAVFKDRRTLKLSEAPAGIVLAFSLTLLTAVSDEIHQLFVPGRAGLPTDVLIDMTGALIAFIVISVCFKIKRKSRNKRKQNMSC